MNSRYRVDYVEMVTYLWIKIVLAEIFNLRSSTSIIHQWMDKSIFWQVKLYNLVEHLIHVY